MSKISPFLRVVIGGILAMSAVSAFGSIASYNDYFVMCFLCALLPRGFTPAIPSNI